MGTPSSLVLKLAAGGVTLYSYATPYGPVSSNTELGLDFNDAPSSPATWWQILVWATTAPAAVQPTQLELQAWRSNGGWLATDQGPSATIQITDPRYAKRVTGSWFNQNHPDQDLGYAADPTASAPKHGVAGVLQDAEQDPVGAAEAVAVAASAAPLAPFLPAAAELGVGLAATGDATGVTQGATSSLLHGAVTAVTHPAETGRTLAGAELALAQSATGLPTTKLSGLLGPKTTKARAPGPSSASSAPAAAAATVKRGFWQRVVADIRFALTGETT